MTIQECYQKLEGSKEWFDRVTEQYNITIDAIRAVQ